MAISFWFFLVLNAGEKPTELNRHGTCHPQSLSGRQGRWGSEFLQPTGLEISTQGNMSPICLRLPHHYLSMRIALFFRKNQKKVFGKQLCLFLLPLLVEACRQTEPVTYLQSTAVQGNTGYLLNYGANKDRKYNMKFGALPAPTSRKDLIMCI